MPTTDALPRLVPPPVSPAAEGLPAVVPPLSNWRAGAVEAPPAEASLADLAQPVPPIRPDLPGQAVYETFARVPNLFTVAVVDASARPVGVVNRFRFLEALSRPFGLELLSGRPAESFMERAPLIVDECTPLDVVADLLADDSTKYIFDGFIVTRAGRYLGMGTGFGLMRRLTERKQITLQHLANHDVLTDLPNRQLFSNRFDQALARSRSSGRRTAVLHIDVDRFKNVNDVYGHSAGDLLLLAIAARLSESVRAQDTVARLSGDEFGIILVELADAADAEPLAAKLLARCAEPHDLEGSDVRASCSIGLAVFPDDGSTSDELLRAAADALYHAKEVRNSWQRYVPDLRRAGEHVFAFS